MITLLAQAPALPLHTAGKYVAAAYIVFVLVLIIYVGIMAKHLRKNQAELLELRALLEEREREQSHSQSADEGDEAGIGDGGVGVA